MAHFLRLRDFSPGDLTALLDRAAKDSLLHVQNGLMERLCA